MCWICAETVSIYVFSRALKFLYGCAEFVLKLCKKNALKLYYSTFSQERWIFSTDVLNLCWNFVRNALKLYCFTFSRERWTFSTDALNLCWIFARIALKFYFFHVFSKVLKLFFGCAEFALKLCKNALKLYSLTFSQERWNFSTVVLNLCWNFVRIALKFYCFTFSQERWKFSTDVLNLCRNFARNALKFYCFYVFSGALKFFYGCGEFGLKLCKKSAEVLLFSLFLKCA